MEFDFFRWLQEDFWLAFIPFLVAFDAIGVLPIYVSLTTAMSKEDRTILLRKAILTALAVALIFLFGGKALFSVLGITSDDFRIGGGLILLLIALGDLLSSAQTPQRQVDREVAIVPIGVPLIMGPAALTSILMLVDRFGYWTTFTALILNLWIVYCTFHYSDYILKIVGKSGTKAIGKIASIFLVAIAIMMIRVGVFQIIKMF